ncbi:MAG: UvrD-helicase domain-containing protein [Ignavibacteriales bacterium]|nr:MAG: AAA family ATPase [Ignavibacteriaceae bacterium]MBW7872538.1 UvrD-helicase domain-containing protein [Ignavibacteria bacterium]MCZ2141909.1 UvrD-helicase domain-containing protein [Ignavibacteriales bacterium]OQY79527.1 MAG: hypothetical protein B6D45_00625 [Ignavibacteriales bacterium UTCHB3]MBV6445076.1 ATP-dependent helicase/nuclease subunit A [Ignavibacteriaceae bacterium]
MSKLTNKQAEATDLSNHILVTANAGSGKTKVLSERYINALLEANIQVNEIAAITFTEKAASELYAKIRKELEAKYEEFSQKNDKKKKEKIDGLIKDLLNSNISTIHSFCLGILKEFPIEAGIDPSVNMITPVEATQLVVEVINEMIADAFRNKNSGTNSRSELNNPEDTGGNDSNEPNDTDSKTDSKEINDTNSKNDSEQTNDTAEKEIKKLIRLFQSVDTFKSNMITLVNERKKLRSYRKSIGNNETEEGIYQATLQIVEIFLRTLFPKLEENVELLQEVNSEILHLSSGESIAEEASNLFMEYFATDSIVAKFESLSEILSIITGSDKSIRKRGYLSQKIAAEIEQKKIIAFRQIHESLIEVFNQPASKAEQPETVNQEAEPIYGHETERLLRKYAEYTSLILKYYDKIIDGYKLKKDAAGVIDYEDMLLLASKILETESVKKALSNKFKYIMIDEYQDTNDLQYEIFIPLLEDFSKGNLYVVGDKKQSIYGFRDADLNVFDKTLDTIERANGKQVVLGHTFRLTKELTAFVNSVFPSVFRSKNALIDGSDEDFEKKRKLINAVDYEQTHFFNINKPLKESEIGLIINRDENKQNTVDVRLEEEALLLANHLKLHKNEPAQKVKSDSKTSAKKPTIAILTRKRNNFKFLEAALANEGVPYELVGGKEFFQQLVVQDISLIFNFITDPGDNLNLYALLRSPFFSLSDVDLLRIANQEEDSAFEKLKTAVSPNSYDPVNERTKKALEVLQKLLRLANEARPHKIIEFMISETPYLAIMTKVPGGKQNLANIKKLINKSVEFDGRNFNSLHDYAAELKDLILTEDSESQAPLSEDSDTVKIMTIHQAKGLEFTTVYLFAATESAVSTGIQSHNSLTVNKDLGLVFKVSETEDIFYQNKTHLHHKVASFFKNQVEKEEAKRVFYVAVTRAENNLFITGSSSRVRENEPGIGIIEPKSYMEMLLKGLGLVALPGENLTIKAPPLSVSEFNDSGEITETTENEIEFTVKIIDSVIPAEPDETTAMGATINTLKPNYTFAANRIEKKYAGEIISATKYLTFEEDPYQYYLKYISGLSGIPEFEELLIKPDDDSFESDDKSDFHGTQTIATDGERNGADNQTNVIDSERSGADTQTHAIDREDDPTEDTKLVLNEGEQFPKKFPVLASVIGSVVHEYLKLAKNREYSKGLVQQIIDEMVMEHAELSEKREKIEKEVKNKLSGFLNSEVATEIFNSTSYRNEEEIFISYRDFYLMGVIDKLVFHEDKIIIIDYKTDKNPNQETRKRYRKQLYYYAFLCSLLYKKINTFELRLLFLVNPESEKSVTLERGGEELISVGKTLDSFIEALRSSFASGSFRKKSKTVDEDS